MWNDSSIKFHTNKIRRFPGMISKSIMWYNCKNIVFSVCSQVEEHFYSCIVASCLKGRRFQSSFTSSEDKKNSLRNVSYWLKPQGSTDTVSPRTAFTLALLFVFFALQVTDTSTLKHSSGLGVCVLGRIWWLPQTDRQLLPCAAGILV